MGFYFFYDVYALCVVSGISVNVRSSSSCFLYTTIRTMKTYIYKYNTALLEREKNESYEHNKVE